MQLFFKNLKLAIIFVIGSIFLLSVGNNLVAQNDQNDLGSAVDNSELLTVIEQLPKLETEQGTQVVISLSDLVELYILYSRQVKQAILQAQAQYDFAGAAKEPFSPYLSLKISNSVGAPQFSNPLIANNQQNTDALLSLRQLTTWGPSYYVSFLRRNTSIRTITADTPYNLENNQVTVSPELTMDTLSVGLKIPLLKGLGANNVITGLQKQLLTAKKGYLGAKQAVQDTSQRIISLYWDVVSLLELIDSLQAKVNLNNNLKLEIEQRVADGLLPRSSAIEIDYLLQQDQNSLRLTQYQLQEIIDAVKESLQISDIKYGFAPGEPITTPELSWDVEELRTKLQENSLAYQQLLTDGQVLQLDKKLVTDNRQWRLDFDINFNQHAYSSELGKTTLGSSKEASSYELALTLEVPLGKSPASYGLDGNQKLIDSYSLALAQQQSSFKLAAQQYLNNLQLNESQIQSSQKAVDLAEVLIEQDLERLRAGQLTVSDFDQSQQRLISAKMNKLDAQIKYLKTYYALSIAAGKLTEFFPRLAPLYDQAIPNP